MKFISSSPHVLQGELVRFFGSGPLTHIRQALINFICCSWFVTVEAANPYRWLVNHPANQYSVYFNAGYTRLTHGRQAGASLHPPYPLEIPAV
jgi:hypothetical protein